MKSPSIFPHENLESLLEALLGALQNVKGSRTLLKPVPVIVPSIQFSDWLQVAIAKRRGLCMGLEFIMPQEFIERALSLADSAIKGRNNPWSKRNLTWRLLPHIRSYATQLGVKEPSPRDRFALAGLLADQFDQYGHFRPEFIVNWNQGKTAAKNGWNKTDKENEAWQRELWRKVQSDIKATGSPYIHPSLVLAGLAENEGFLKSLKVAFPSLLVLGTGTFDPLLVRVLQLLGNASCDVQAHVALPSLGYLGELRNSPRAVEQDPEKIEMGEGHPLLVSMGRHAIGSFLLLGELDENYTHWPDDVPGAEEDTASSLLSRLQTDIRQLRKPAGDHVQRDEDLSIRVHSCYGPRREMEVLRDELLRAFNDIKDLKPEEVIVVTPALETYAPLVAAVLEQAPPLPIRLTELPPSEQDPVAEGLLALLEMSRGSCEASRLLELVHLRATRSCLGISDDPTGLDHVRDWICQSGITRGLEGEGELSTAAIGSWRFARDRIIAGQWFGPEDGARYPGEKNYVLPVAEDLGADADLKETFLEWHWQLSRTLREWKGDATATHWGERLGNACIQLLSEKGDEDSRLEIQYALNFLSQLDCTEKIDAGAIFDWLQSESAESGRRTPVSGRITFGRLKQLQNIPCRVLAMVGMQDGAFPRQNRVPAWDLLHCDPRVWDRNARIDDRQLFLDAVLTPKDRLIITASTRNVRSGKAEPFSSCVDELIRVAQSTAQNEKGLVIDHRLQPFVAGYFKSNSSAESLPLSFDSNSAKIAESFLKRSTQTIHGIPFWNPNAPSGEQKIEETREITLDQLVGFWKDPAKVFLRGQGITLAFDEGNDEVLDRTPLGLDGLQRWAVKDAIIQDVMEGESSLDYTKAFLFANRVLPPSELGKLNWEALADIAEPLGEKITEIMMEPLLVDFLVPEIAPAVRITGRILQGKLEGHGLLAYRTGKFKGPKDYLQPWIQAIVAASVGNPQGSCLLDDESLESPKLMESYETDEALELLRHLIAGFLLGQSRPLCYAPETSDAYARACEEWEETPDQSALGSASDEWNREPNDYSSAGEGFSAAAALAWRDLDPFEDPAAWHQWTGNVAKPLRSWFAPQKPKKP